MLYISIIFVFTAISVLLGVYVGVPVLGVSEGLVFEVTMWSLIVLLLIDTVCTIVVRYCFPKKMFNPFLKIYDVKKWERKFYEKIGIRKWKDRIPEAGKYFVDFNKSEVEDMSNNKYVLKFMEETAYAEIMHILSAVLSILIVFISPKLFLLVGLPLFIGNVILNVMPVMVQRYNRPKLMTLYKRNERNQMRAEQTKKSEINNVEKVVKSEEVVDNSSKTQDNNESK